MVVKELVALLGVKTDKASQKRAEGGMNRLIGLAKAAAVAFAGLKIVQFLKGTVNEVATLGDRFDKLAKRTGLAASKLQELEHAAELSGASLGDIETAIKRLQSSQVEAADGSAEYADEFKRMGLEVKNADGTFKDTTDLLVEMSDGLKGLDSDAERTAVAVKLLGRGGMTLIPMFKEGSDALREMMGEMEQLGGIIDDEMIQATADYIDNQRRMQVAMRGVKNAIAKELIPKINDLTDAFIKWWKANGQVIRQRLGLVFGKLGAIISKNVRFFGDLLRRVYDFLDQLTPLQKKILAVGAAVTGLGVLLRAGPIGRFLLLATVIAGVIEDFQTWKEGGKSAIGTIMAKLGELLDMDLSYEQWSADMDFFAEHAGSAISGLIDGMTQNFASFTIFLSEVFDDPVGAWERAGARTWEIWREASAKIQGAFDAIGIDFKVSVDGMLAVWVDFIRGVERWVDIIVASIEQKFGKIADLISKIYGGKGGPATPGGAGKVLGGGGTATGRASPTTIVGPTTTISVDVKASPGMSEAALGAEVGKAVRAETDRQNRAAMRALSPSMAGV